PDLIAIRYLEALQGIANGQATKIFLPLDTSGVLGSVAAVGELFKAQQEGGATA
ncbi:MAG: SPFH/Band 7/PHB domain protein, partial [Actinomycetes bacterium]